MNFIILIYNDILFHSLINPNNQKIIEFYDQECIFFLFGQNFYGCLLEECDEIYSYLVDGDSASICR